MSRRRPVAVLVLFGLAVSLLAVAAQLPDVPPAAAATTCSSYDQCVGLDNPGAYWKLDETGTVSTFADQVANNRSPLSYEGFVSNDQPSLFGVGGLQPGRSVKIGLQNVTTGNQDSDLFAQGSSTLHPDDFSLEFFFKGQANTSEWTEDIARLGSGLRMYWDWFSHCKITIRQAAGDGSDDVNLDCAKTSAVLSDGSPHHVAITKDRSTATVYIDGVVMDSASTGNKPTYYAGSTEPVQFGRGHDTVDAPDATFDNISLFDHPLSADAVVKHYKVTPLAVLRALFGHNKAAPTNADPIVVSAGNWVYDAEKAVPVAPPSAYGVTVGRTYNHLASVTDETGLSQALNLGRGWTTTLDTSITALSDGSLEFRDGDGRRVQVASTHSSGSPSAPDRWNAPEGYSGEIRKNTQSSPPSGSNVYVLQFSSGERWEFDSSGRLAKKCQGVADWAGRSDWSSTAGWVVGNDWCGASGTSPYSVIDWSQKAASSNAKITVTSWLDPSTSGASQTFKLDAANGKLTQIIAHDDSSGVSSDRLVDFHYTSGRLDWTSFPHYPSEAGSSSAPPLYGFEAYGYDSNGLINEVKLKAGQYTSGADQPTDTGAFTLVTNTYDATTGRVTDQTTETADDHGRTTSPDH